MPRTGTPSISSISTVRGRSRIALAPAQTTATGYRASAVRSAETSPVSPTPRCTPPIPPVANTRMPACQAANIVAATVVEPQPPAATSAAKLPRLTFTGCAAAASRSSSGRVIPTRTVPSRIPIVAGIAPWARTASSRAAATRTPSGCGRPCVTSVVSRATTGLPAATAAATSAATWNRLLADEVMVSLPSSFPQSFSRRTTRRAARRPARASPRRALSRPSPRSRNWRLRCLARCFGRRRRG